MNKTKTLLTIKSKTQPDAKEMLRRIVNYWDQDPDLFLGDDDGVLRKLMDDSRRVLKQK